MRPGARTHRELSNALYRLHPMGCDAAKWRSQLILTAIVMLLRLQSILNSADCGAGEESIKRQKGRKSSGGPAAARNKYLGGSTHPCRTAMPIRRA